MLGAPLLGPATLVTVLNLRLRPSFTSPKLLPNAIIGDETTPHPPSPRIPWLKVAQGRWRVAGGTARAKFQVRAPPPAPRKRAPTATSLPSGHGRVSSSVSWSFSLWGRVWTAPLVGVLEASGATTRKESHSAVASSISYVCRASAGCQMRTKPLSLLATVGDSSCDNRHSSYPLAAGRVRNPRPRAGAAL